MPPMAGSASDRRGAPPHMAKQTTALATNDTTTCDLRCKPRHAMTTLPTERADNYDMDAQDGSDDGDDAIFFVDGDC